MIETWWLALNITRRNWMVYKKDFVANISPTVADPALLLLTLGLGLGASIAEIGGRSYLEYLAPGLCVSTAMFTSFFESSYGFYVRMTFENVFKAMLSTPIGIREVVLGELLWVSLKGAVMSLGVAIVLLPLGLVQGWHFLPLVALTGAVVGLGCGSMGLIASSKVRNINQFQTIYSFLIAPVFYFSGIFFPLEQMPGALKWVSYFLPLSHAVAINQAIFWGESLGSKILVHLPPLALISFLLSVGAARAVTQRLQV